MTRKPYLLLLNALERMKKSEALKRAYKEQQTDYIIPENHSHKMFEAGRDLWRPSCLAQAGPPRATCPGLCLDVFFNMSKDGDSTAYHHPGTRQ